MSSAEAYILSGILHDGERSVLYRATSARDRAPVVLKTPKSDFPSPDDVARIEHEHAIASALDIPGVVKIFGLSTYRDRPALVMEDHGDQSLHDAIQARSLDLKAVLRIGSALARILGDLHDEDVVHKDISPRNILVRPETLDVTLIDFSVAARLSRYAHAAPRTGSLEGTLLYMSPEQTGRQALGIDARSDLYSLGATLYEALTGVVPFQAADPLELVHAHLARMPAPPIRHAPGLPRVVSDIVMKLLAKAPEERYQSARSLKADLDTCLSQLDRTGHVAPFALGSHDVPDDLRLPHKLYGRETESAALVDAWRRVLQGAAELVLVSGHAGVGKSALVRDVLRGPARRHGYFVEGKFDQLSRRVPYAPFAHAFRDLVRQILTERAERLAVWKQRIQDAVGAHGQLLTRLIPELTLVIGPQMALQELGPTESQSRFAFTFQNFLRVFAAADHPLVLFLDDLQWADPASLKLLQILLSDPSNAYLLVVTAYRDPGLPETQPLTTAASAIERAGARVGEIALGPLDRSNARQLVADALRCDLAYAAPLADLAFEKTQGNPFFLGQLLRAIYREGLLRFDIATGAWAWEIPRIQATLVTDDVVLFMVNKLQQLAPDTQRVLKLAACIGHELDLKTLSVIDERPPAEVATALAEALREGLLLALDAREPPPVEGSSDRRAPALLSDATPNASYRFLHDRVQQAAYSLIAEEERRGVHLTIGRLMLAQRGSAPHDGELLDVVNHLNLGAALIADGGERIELARLNLAAGRKSKAATAYEAAAGYFVAGISLLPRESWEGEYALTFALHAELAECEYLSGRSEQAESLFELLLSRARSKFERVELHKLRVVLCTMQGAFTQAVESGRLALALLGIDVPDDDEACKEAAEAELAAVATNLGRRRVEELIDAPAMVDPEKQAAARILADLFSCCYMQSANLLAYTAIKHVNLSLQHGHTDVSPFAYANFGFTLAAVLGRFEEGYEFGELAVKLNDKLQNKELTCKVNFLFGCGISFYRRPLRLSLDYFRRGYEAGVAAADYVHLSYTCQHTMMMKLGMGDDLGALGEENDKHLALVQQIKEPNVAMSLILVRQAIANLKGRTSGRSTLSDATFDEGEYLASMLRAGYAFTLCWYHIVKLQLLFLHEDYAGALAMAFEAERRIAANLGMYSATELPFYFCLTLAALYPSAEPDEKKRYVTLFAEQLRKLAIWAESCPETFQQKLLLAQAELARITGEDLRAADLYDRALDAAKENGFLNHEALANELCAKYYLFKGRRKIAHVYMSDAYHGYRRWGAMAKAEDIAKRFPHVRAPLPAEDLSAGAVAAKRMPAELLDMETLLSTAQAIASEIVLDRVLDRWMRVVIETAGAQKGTLILSRRDRLMIEASITVDPDEVQLGPATPLESSTELPQTVVQYVARTREPVILTDALRDGRFAKDAYLIAQRPKSILCLAMTHQGRMTGVLYLENNMTYEAFTPARLQLLGLLGSQAATAVENALLYAHVQEVTELLRRSNETLEQEVAARTEDLRRATEDLRQTNLRLEHELVERARAEEARAALQNAIIRVQKTRLTELSSPLIPIRDHIMVMPLIGQMDEERATLVLETALKGAQANKTHVVIIDITGVSDIDEGVASTLVRTAGALRLLGTRVVLTGIGPAVAQTLVQLGLDLSSITTRATLQSGISYAMAKTRRGR